MLILVYPPSGSVSSPIRAPGAPGRDPLRVPIFTTFGNHDYRMHPYNLRFLLDLPNADADIGIYGRLRLPKDRQSDQYEPHNLTKPEATELEGNPSLKPWL